MNANIANNYQFSQENHSSSETDLNELQFLKEWLQKELETQINSQSPSIGRVATRLAQEIQRVCSKSDRIRNSGEVRVWEISLGRHRLNKCLSYYQLGSQRGRVELHSNLSVMVYRHISVARNNLGFSGKYNLIEDFLQDFYVESLKAFRRENEVSPDYQPRTKLELAEYMAFTEQYAKRRITLPNGYSQQLIILRAQSFARRQPDDTVVDLEQATDFSKLEDNQTYNLGGVMQQIRVQMVSDTPDPSDSVLRQRLINALFEYLEDQKQTDCADYLTLKLQDLTASEIDEILNLTPRQRDYLQQRFKYHVDKFARASHWQLVHEWLEADLEQKLGLISPQWDEFIRELSPQQSKILELKMAHKKCSEIGKIVGLTPKKLQKQWTAILEVAWKIRNQTKE
jgi:hypothetical protein